jgi:hypothetical protein
MKRIHLHKPLSKTVHFAAMLLWTLIGSLLAEPKVSPEGLRLYAAHTNFMAFAESHDSDIKAGVNDNELRVFWSRLSGGFSQQETQAGAKIPIPGIMGRFVASMPATVRQLKVQLETGGNVDVSLREGDKTHKVNPWWNAENRTVHYFNLGVLAETLKKRAFPASTADLFLMVKADAGVKGVWSGGVGGVPAVCDLSRFSSLGADLPLLKAALTVDATALRFIGGVCALGATNYFRLYALPEVPMAAGDSLSNVSEGVYAQREFLPTGFLPGRQQFQFSGFERAKRFQEDPKKPGWTDRAWVASEKAKAEPAKRAAFLGLWGNFEWMECFDNWPSWMALKGPGVKNLRGTPDEKYWDAAAELASDQLAVRFAQTGKHAGWYEVKNESDLSDEWAYHAINKPGEPDGWDRLAAFHNLVAKRLHADHPGSKVGGPTTAWLNFAFSDMRVAKNLLRFMDLTRADLDFYAHHYYGDNTEFTSTRKDHFLYGNIDGVTDLLRTHMALTGNVKPILVSECGGANADNSSGVETFSHIYRNHVALFHFMDHPDVFPMTAFFTLPAVWWAKDDKTPLMVYRDPKAGKAGGLERSKLFAFLEFWSAFARGGKRIPVDVKADENEHAIRAQAILRDRQILIALFNPKPRRAELSLDSVLPPGIRAVRAERKRLFIDLGEWRVESGPAEGKTIALAGCETTLLTLELSGAPAPIAAQREETYFADREMVDTGAATPFRIAAPVKNLRQSRLRVSLYLGPAWKNENLSVSIGGRDLPTRYSLSKMNGLYTSFEFDVPTTLLAEKNEFIVASLPHGGRVAALTLRNTYR